jgi:hypothetical protein
MPTQKPILKIANAQAFWGDDPAAPLRTVQQQPDLDVLTLDYLAEVSMSILAKQREKDPNLGYAQDFLNVLRDLAPIWRGGHRLQLVTNAGGLNPIGCAKAAVELLREAGVTYIKIAAVTGDDVLPQIRAAVQRGTAGFENLETGQPISEIAANLVSANAYLGAAPIVDALKGGGQIIITGRVADPSLTVAPAISHFGWSADNWAALANATVAGHLIECGTQVTGGIATDWLDIVKNDDRPIGLPVVEIDQTGSCVVTKPQNTAGRVNLRTVKEQLLYELGDPAKYLSPDVTVNFLTIDLKQIAPDRVLVTNATSGAPPDKYKVSATYRAGYRCSATLMLGGGETQAKAHRAAERLLASLKDDGFAPQRSNIEIIPDTAFSFSPATAGKGRGGGLQSTLRVSVADSRREVVEAFSRRVMSLITAGPQGITAYADGRPPVREVVAYWPTLIPRSVVHPTFEILEV